MNIIDGAEVDINCKHLKHVQFLPIISLWEFQKFELDYLENIPMKFRENFAIAVTCHYLPLILPAEFLIKFMAALDIFTVIAIISLWQFRRTNSMSIVLETAHSNLE